MPDIQSLIIQAALDAGIDPYLALAVATQESGLNPNAVGDGGYSFGLYQENTAGGAGSTFLNNGGNFNDFFDPYSSTLRFADRVKYAQSQLGPDATPGEIAYAAQRPANRDAYIGAINGLYGSGGADMTYDPSLFGETGQDTGTDNPPPPDTGAGGGLNIFGQPTSGNPVGDFWNFITGIFKPGDTGTATTSTPPVPGSEDKGPPIHYQSLGNGRILFTYSDGSTEVKDFGTAGTSAAPYKSLDQAAAAAGFYKPDGSPDTQSYLDYQARKLGTAGGTASKNGIVNLGSGRYLTQNPDGTYTEHSFGGTAAGAGGVTPPSLDPTRSSIVSYLRALLGQNDLPYSGVTPAQAPASGPSSTPPSGSAQPPAPAPSLATPPSLTPTTPAAALTPPPAFSTPGTVSPTVPTLITEPNIPPDATIAAPYGKQVSLAPGWTPDAFMKALGQ